MEWDNLSSILSLRIHCAGVILISAFSLFLARSLPRGSVGHWAIAWWCLSLSALSLLAAFSSRQLQGPLYSIHFLFEYAFGFMLVAGCRTYATGKKLTARSLAWLAPFGFIAALLPTFSSDYDSLLVPQTFVMALFYSAALYWIFLSRRRSRISPGWIIISMALVLLPLNLFQYHPLLTHVLLRDVPLPLTYLSTKAIYDLALEIVLGLGMLMVVMESMRREVEEAHARLVTAHGELKALARVDPLTDALNRRAFYSLLNKETNEAVEQAGGSAAIIDMDNLKPINDSFGHAAGDAAIREVARALRSVIRADDLLFRWGGDEFLILLFGVAEDEARSRLEEINSSLALTRLPSLTAAIPITISYGLSRFSNMGEVEQAIQAADYAMYRSKKSRKALSTRPDALHAG